jgi:hypothetical protein
MTDRKKRLRIIQLCLLFFGILIIFVTYSEFNLDKDKSFTKPEAIKKSISDKTGAKDIFYNIEYSGIDIAGNRYILKSLEAYNNENNQELVNLKSVQAVFYFKDDTVLYVKSDKGLYNNKTLDMIFENNVKSTYNESELFANKAEYSNSSGYLRISEKVKIKDTRGTMFADELIFYIKNQKLKIASGKNSSVKANINKE